MFSSKAIGSSYLNGLARCLAIVVVVCALSSCDLATNFTKLDRSSNSETQDFRDALSERLPEVNKQKPRGGTIPELQPYVSTGANSIKSTPLVSISVNQTVPLKDILYELAQQAEYDIELDPNIRGSIIFTARNKPFDVVVDRISKLAGLRYKFDDSFLRVELDTPYVKTYKIDYLSFIRSSEKSVSTNVSVVSGEGADTGSAYSSSSESTSDFWAELELNLQQVLGGATTGALKTATDPRITAADPNPDAELATTDGSGNVPEVVLNVESLPVDNGFDDPSLAATPGAGEGAGTGTFSINKQAGLINVFATEHAHEEVLRYLNDLKKSVASQVLIEAKVFEVTLNDEFINGIDWQILHKEGVANLLSNTGSTLISSIAASPNASGFGFLPTGTVATTSGFTGGWIGNDVQALIKSISGFGTVRALASPRLTVLNNQSAVLNVATNRVYFDIDLTRETDDDTGDITLEVDSEIKSVPEGVLINVLPSINMDERTVSMSVRPTVTNIVNTVEDPSVAFMGGGLFESNIPEVNIQEIDTVVKVNSGQPIVMGGLMQDTTRSIQEGVPILGEVPIVGAMFRSQGDLVRKTELVIFLRATILDSPETTIHNTDRDLYRAFSGDRRPFKL